jgi:hypothetical protein
VPSFLPFLGIMSIVYMRLKNRAAGGHV